MNYIYLYALMSVEAILLGSELVASQLTHSLIILTDAYHTLYNILSIILLIISFKMSKQTTVKNTFGWARIEVLGMLVNMTFLVALTFSLLVEGIQQLVHSSHEISEPTNFYLLFILGFCGLTSNLIYFNVVSGVIMRRTKQRTDSLGLQEKVLIKDVVELDISSPSTSATKTGAQNSNKLIIYKSEVQKINALEEGRTHQQNVFFGLFRDLTGSLLMILCAVGIMFTSGTVAHIIDPIFGMLSALIFCATLYPNMKNTGLILLQTVPENIDVGRLRIDIKKEFPVILNIHDLHVWGLTASRIIATCHIILPKLSSECFDDFSKSLNNFFQRQGIILATVQPEFDEQNERQNLVLNDFSCIMKCSKFSKTNCDSYTCCKDDKSECIHRNKNKDMNNSEDKHFEEVVAENVDNS